MTLAEQFDCFLLDLDGTLYRGDDPIPGAEKAVADLQAANKRVVFMTNNSGRTPEDILTKLAGFGIAASSEDVVTSAMATARLLEKRGVESAFVVGGTGLRKALVDAGIDVLDDGAKKADVVVVGWDRTADYLKLKNAGLLIQRGSALIATNADNAFPAPDGLWPGAGALLSVITTTTGAEAEIVGKPHAPLFEEARRAGGGGTPLVVGDRLDTDIKGAADLGWDSLLVFTGIAQPSDLAASDVHASFTGKDLSVLFEDPAPRSDSD
jgi:HAD superfamily hydrolase (TIGR01457 family)